MVSFAVLTAAPAEVGPCPVLASALVNELRAELVLSAASVAALEFTAERLLALVVAPDDEDRARRAGAGQARQ
jgi:hypothetical protein